MNIPFKIWQKNNKVEEEVGLRFRGDFCFMYIVYHIPYHTEFDVHLLQIQIHCCEINHITDIIITIIKI